MEQSNDLPPELLSIMLPALQVGGIAGLSGLVFGGVAGVLRSTTPTLFALASGIQWFTLGSTFSVARGTVLHAWGYDAVTARNKINASTIAGGIAGCAGGFLRGRRNVLPGMTIFAILGAAGQIIYNTADVRRNENILQDSEARSGRAWLESKWSPVKILSDDEYERMLQEKLLRVKAEMALVDESIMGLRSGRPQKFDNMSRGNKVD